MDEEIQSRLDKYEGEGTLYNRTMAQAVNPALTEVCYTYLYRGQFNDIRLQEGPSDIWYGRKVFLGFDNDGCEIYTLTSKELRIQNEPAPEYLELIEKALKKYCGYDAKSVKSYIESCKMGL